MYKTVRHLVMLILSFFSGGFVLSAENYMHVELDEALSLAKRYFEGQDVDYYLIEKQDSVSWKIFVDAEPNLSCVHKYYTVFIPRYSKNGENVSIDSVKLHRFAPNGKHAPLDAKPRWVSSDKKPFVKKQEVMTYDVGCSEKNHNYAIILSGGIKVFNNSKWYWNDCSFMYQILVNKYNIPKENIRVLMSDGTDPGVDARNWNPTYFSSPLDLDFDGEPDIQYAATKENLKNVLTEFSNSLTSDDHLFLFVTDHGNYNDYPEQCPINNCSSCIYMWVEENEEEEKITDEELYNMLKPLYDKKITISSVMGQCFSGGFIDEFSEHYGYTIATAATGTQSSWAYSKNPSEGCDYSEFLLQWMTAINEADPDGNPVDSDINKDGMVSFEEAFIYAKSHDRMITKETPQYDSYPETVGKYLSFHDFSPKKLYIQRYEDDYGFRDLSKSTLCWNSPDIVLRNEPDGILEHEQPYINRDEATIYLRVTNNSWIDYAGGDSIEVYWAYTSTAYKSSLFSKSGNNLIPDGGYIATVPIPPVEYDWHATIPVTWEKTNGFESDISNPQDISIITRYVDKNQGPSIASFCISPYTDSGIAIKNVIQLPQDNNYNCRFLVRNVWNMADNIYLEIRPHSEQDQELLSKSKITVGPILNFGSSTVNSVVDHAPEGGLIGPISVAANNSINKLLSIEIDETELLHDRYQIDILQESSGTLQGVLTIQLEAPKVARKNIISDFGIRKLGLTQAGLLSLELIPVKSDSKQAIEIYSIDSTKPLHVYEIVGDATNFKTNISELTKGYYFVIYKIDGNVIERKQIIKNS